MSPVIIIVAALALLPSLVPADRLITSLAPGGKPAQTLEVTPTKLPVRRINQPLSLTASNAYALDRVTGQALYQKSADAERPIASITKLATAAVILHGHKLDEEVAIPALPAYLPEDEIMGLQKGEHYPVRDLLAATLINSANDAADSLAIYDSGSVAAFSAKMNRILDEWQIKGAHFSNPSGLSDQGNTASAKAVAQIGLLVLHNTEIKDLIASPTGNVTSREGRSTPITSTNQLLQTGRYKGIKTGYTVAAGQCFVGLTTVQGHEIVTVVLGSQDRLGETQALVNWINDSYTWQ